MRWGTVRGRGYGRKERVWETLVGGVKEDTWACVRMGSGGGGSIVRTTAGTRKEKVEKMRRGVGARKKRSKKCVERAERIARKNASGSKKCVGGASENKGRKNASGVVYIYIYGGTRKKRSKKCVERAERMSRLYIYIIEVRVTGAVDGSGFELRVNWGGFQTGIYYGEMCGGYEVGER